jgi:hypothetical protein
VVPEDRGIGGEEIRQPQEPETTTALGTTKVPDTPPESRALPASARHYLVPVLAEGTAADQLEGPPHEQVAEDSMIADGEGRQFHEPGATTTHASAEAPDTPPEAPVQPASTNRDKDFVTHHCSVPTTLSSKIGLAPVAACPDKGQANHFDSSEHQASIPLSAPKPPINAPRCHFCGRRVRMPRDDRAKRT